MIAFAYEDLGLHAGQRKALARKATREGKATPQYLRLLIEQDLLSEMPFDDILRPIRRDFKKSGVTQAKLDQIVRRGRAVALSKSAPGKRKSPPH